MIKTAVVAAALAFTAACAGAETGLTKDVTRTNVQALGNGSVGPAFHVAGVGYFVSEVAAPYAKAGPTVVPAQYDLFDVEDVAAYLDSVGVENYRIVLKTNSKTCSPKGAALDPDADASECRLDDGIEDSVTGASAFDRDRVVNGGW